MDPAIAPPTVETASGQSGHRPWWRRAVWALSAVLVVCGLLAGTMAWLLRAESLRQRVEAALVQALGRPVFVRAADWRWQSARAEGGVPAQIIVQLHGIEVPPVESDGVRRGVGIGQVGVVLRAAPSDWWRAWRGKLPWPVMALQAQQVRMPPPRRAVGDAADDGWGEVELERLELTGIVAAANAPRVLRAQALGRWQRAPEQPWARVSADLREVAFTPGFAGGFSLEQAALQLGALQVRLARLSVGEGSATFAAEMLPANLREALPPLGIPVPPTEDPKTFERVSVKAECNVDFDVAKRGAGCDSVVLKVDDTTFTGQAWRAPQAQGDAATLWQLRLAADQLNLDRYLPPENLQEPPTAVPWNLADAWPLRFDLTVRDLRLAGLRMSKATLALQAGEQGLVRE